MNITNNFSPINNINSINRTNFKGVEASIKPVHVDAFLSRSKGIIDVLDECITKTIRDDSISLTKRFSLAKILKEAIPEISREENLINKGRESKVFRINDNYVAKFQRGQNPEKSISTFDMVYIPDKSFSQLECYYGEPVLKAGGVEILKNAVPNGVSMEVGTKFHYRGYPKAEEIEKYNKEYLPLCASLPQESFDELALCLQQMNGIKRLGFAREFPWQKAYVPNIVHYTPDVINPNNILISNGKFRIVDKLDKTSVNKPNTFYTMAEPLLIRYCPEYYAKRDEALLLERQNILQKCIIAAEKAGLSFEPNPLTDEFVDFYLSSLANDGKKCFYHTPVRDIKNMRSNGVPTKQRVEYLKDYFNSLK